MRRRMVRVVEPVKGLVEERWWVVRKWRVRMRLRMDVMIPMARGPSRSCHQPRWTLE